MEWHCASDLSEKSFFGSGCDVNAEFELPKHNREIRHIFHFHSNVYSRSLFYNRSSGEQQLTRAPLEWRNV